MNTTDVLAQWGETPRERELALDAAMLGIVPCAERDHCNGCAVDGNRAEQARTDLLRRYERERREGNLGWVGSAWLNRDELVAFSADTKGIVPNGFGGRGSPDFHVRSGWNAKMASHFRLAARTGRIYLGWDD